MPRKRYTQAVICNVPGSMVTAIDSLVNPEKETRSDVLRSLLEDGLKARGLMA